MENEIWKDVVGFEGLYQVSSKGRVKSLKQRRSLLKQFKKYNVQLEKSEKREKLRVDMLVAKAFLPKAEIMEVVKHIDGNENNNTVENLVWDNITTAQKLSMFRSNLTRKPRNEWFEENGYIYFKLSNCEKYALCDMDVWQTAQNHRWFLSHGYVFTKINGKNERFHHLVITPKPGYVIDHKNRNPLDNRKTNLRYATDHANALNHSKNRKNTTGVTGVSKTNIGRYKAYINFNGKHIHLGHYMTLEEARKARKEAEEKYFKPIIEKETHV